MYIAHTAKINEYIYTIKTVCFVVIFAFVVVVVCLLSVCCCFGGRQSGLT